MDNLLKHIYNEYNDFEKKGYHIQFDKTALQILKDGVWDLADLKNKIRKYDSEEYQRNNESNQDLASEILFEQPKSMLLTIMYINLIVNALPDSFFIELNLEKEKFIQIILAVVFYTLFLNTFTFLSKPLTRTEEKWLLSRDDFYFGLEEIKKVCWGIEKRDFETFCDKFTFDIRNKQVSELKDEKIYKDGDQYFILCIDEFLEYMLLKPERLFKELCSEADFSEYQRKKGFAFEELVYYFFSQFANNVVNTIYYYPSTDKVAEIDILLQEENYIIIIECKSGTIELKSAHTDIEIKKKIDNKVKKAYRTLENASVYVSSNVHYKFSNKSFVVEGESQDTDILCLHLSMYSFDSLSSNVHILDESYIGKSGNPKITMSFEHFLAICLDCHNTGNFLGSYLKKRKKYIIEHPKARFDNNELDLYYQLMNKGNKSILTESLEKGIFDNFIEDIKTVTTFHDSLGEEFRPASDMLGEIDNRLLNGFFKDAKSRFGLNKRFINYLREYLSVEL